MITPQQFASLNVVPANGTFLTTTTGAVYRVAGGVPFAIGNWSLFGGVQPSVVVDPWDLSNLASPLSHLRAVPADGTVIEGLPSGSYWSFRQGERRPVAASPAAVAIDDADLAPYAVAPRPDARAMRRAQSAATYAERGQACAEARSLPVGEGAQPPPRPRRTRCACRVAVPSSKDGTRRRLGGGSDAQVAPPERWASASAGRSERLLRALRSL